jgi:hypothetical protein
VGNVEDNGDVNRAWNIITVNIKILAKESLGFLSGGIINHGLMRNVQIG